MMLIRKSLRYAKRLQGIFSRYIFKSLNKAIFRSHVTEAFDHLQEPLTLLDLGAAGGIEDRWIDITSYLNYIGAEPDSRSESQLKQNKPYKSYTIIKDFAGATNQKKSFFYTRKPDCSSLYEPNKYLIKQYPDPERFEVVDTKSVDVKSLEHQLMNTPPIDFIKADIQGGELNALTGLGKMLDNCLALELEIEFSEIYKNQPLFGDLCKFLDSRGFYFVDFLTIARWEFENRKSGIGRCVCGDGLWIRKFDALDTDKPDAISKLIAICLLYSRHDEAQALTIKLAPPYSAKLKQLVIRSKRERGCSLIIYKLMSLIFSAFFPDKRLHLLY